MEEEQLEKWTRPSNLEYPRIYYEFTAADPEVGQCVKYVVRDLTEDRFDDAVEFLLEHYLKDEPTMLSRDGISDPKTVEDMVNEFRHLLDKKISQMCTKEGSEEIIAVNLMEVMERNGESEILVNE
jgi:hypothetical protein